MLRVNHLRGTSLDGLLTHTVSFQATYANTLNTFLCSSIFSVIHLFLYVIVQTVQQQQDEHSLSAKVSSE